MSNNATKQDVQQAVDRSVRKTVDEISLVIGDFSQHVDKRFTVLERKSTVLESQVDRRFTALEDRIDKLESSHERLISTLDSFFKKLDDLETENTARDAHIDRLERWVRQIADKAGVKLQS